MRPPSGGILTEKAFDEGEREDLEIEEQGPLPDIFQIVAEAFVDATVAPRPMDLCPARHACPDFMLKHGAWKAGAARLAAAGLCVRENPGRLRQPGGGGDLDPRG
jgi:hypothetical protein